MTAWRMAFRAGTNGDEMWPQCYQLGVAAIEYSPLDDTDLSRYPEGEPKSEWSKLAPSQQANLKRFVYKMDEGHVIYVKEGPMIVGKGIVEGPYQFDKKNRIRALDGTCWQHQRSVRWVADFQPRRIVLGQDIVTVKPLTQLQVKRIEGAAQPEPRVADESDIEGLRIELRITKSKRSRRLRNRAFRAANGICAVCRRDYSKFLNGRGVRVLQVHHRNQLSAHAEPVETHLADLVVVCANCHLLLHLEPDRTFTVDDLRCLLESEGYFESQ